LKLMRGFQTDRAAHVVIAGHAFVLGQAGRSVEQGDGSVASEDRLSSASGVPRWSTGRPA
jgi:hypothetical protein